MTSAHLCCCGISKISQQTCRHESNRCYPCWMCLQRSLPNPRYEEFSGLCADLKKLLIPSTSRTPAERRGTRSINLLATWRVQTLLLSVPYQQTLTSQLVKTGGPQVHKVHQQQGGVQPIEGANTCGRQYLSPFAPEKLATAVGHLNPGNSPALDSIFPRVYTTRLVSSKILAMQFLNFLHSSNSKSPGTEEEHSSCHPYPKPDKPLADPRSYRSLSLCVSPSRFSRDSSKLVSNQSFVHYFRRNRRTFDTGGRPQIRSPC